jgi:hypothetical protein
LVGFSDILTEDIFSLKFAYTRYDTAWFIEYMGGYKGYVIAENGSAMCNQNVWTLIFSFKRPPTFAARSFFEPFII